MAEKPQPKFVNLQTSEVIVNGPDRKPVHVQPFHQSGGGKKGIYVVEGEYYRKYVSGKGPLYPFPVNPKAVPVATPAPVVEKLAEPTPPAADAPVDRQVVAPPAEPVILRSKKSPPPKRE